MNRFMRVFIMGIIIIFLNPRVPVSFAVAQESTDDSSQEAALQREQEQMEAELKRMRQPEVQRERQMLDDMNRAMEKFYQSKDEPSRQKYELLYKQALALPKPSAKIYSACATAANLLGQHEEAITILKKAIVEFPDERAWGPKVPLKISGYYRIGSIALQISDANEATKAYEAVISNSKDVESAKFHKLRSLMILADIAPRLLDDKQLAIKRLLETKETIESLDEGTLQHEDINTLKFLRGWIQYELKRLETGTAPTRQKSDLSKEDFGSPFMLAMTHLTMSYCTMPEIEQAAQDNSSSVESILTRFGLVYDCMHRQKTKDAEKYLFSIVKTDSYFKPYAEVMLEIVHKQRDNQTKQVQ